MAIITTTSRTLSDHQPGAIFDVVVGYDATSYGVRVVTLTQGDEGISMSLDQARAVHDAMALTIAELGALA